MPKPERAPTMAPRQTSDRIALGAVDHSTLRYILAAVRRDLKRLYGKARKLDAEGWRPEPGHQDLTRERIVKLEAWQQHLSPYVD